jgi:hypothetical protein
MMKKVKNNSIVFALKTLSILAFGLLIIPSSASATPGYVDNPVPMISQITPSSLNTGGFANNTVTVYGYGFIPGSIVRANGSERITTFVDGSHLLVQMNGSDFSIAGGVLVNVFNGFPGGGYSNAVTFTTNSFTTNNNTGNNNTNNNNTNSNNTGSNNNSNYINPNTIPTVYSAGSTQPKTTTVSKAKTTAKVAKTNTGDSFSTLAANALFGTNGFLPSGIFQWLIFAIIILVLVIVARKAFGSEDKYHGTPMKHA